MLTMHGKCWRRNSVLLAYNALNTPYARVVMTVLTLVAYSQTVRAFEMYPPSYPENVVYIDLANRQQQPFWRKLEQRFKEELGLLNLRVAVEPISSAQPEITEQTLVDVAVSQGAVAAFVVIKQKGGDFRGLLFVSDKDDHPSSYKEIPIPQNGNAPESETIEVISLKCVEALQAALMIAPQKTAASPLPQYQPIPRKLLVNIKPIGIVHPNQLRFKRLAIAGLVSGGVVLGVAAGLHGWKLHLENDVNMLYVDDKDVPSDSLAYIEQYVKWKDKYDEHNHKGIRISVQLAYSVGGVLTATGFLFLGLYLKKRNGGERREVVSWHPSGTGLVLSF